MNDHSFRTMNALIGCYLGIAVLGFAIAFLFQGDRQVVNSVVWVRDSLMLASAVLLCVFARLAVLGSRRAFTRVRIVSVVIPLAIVVLIALPVPFPLWMRVQQGMGALTVAGLAVAVNGRSARAWLARLRRAAA